MIRFSFSGYLCPMRSVAVRCLSRFCTKVVGATSSEGFLVYLGIYERARYEGSGTRGKSVNFGTQKL